MRSTRVTVTTSVEQPDGTEVEIEVTASVSPGEPEVRYQRNGDPGWPGSGPEVDLLSAKGDDGKDYLAEIESSPEWLAMVDDLCVGEAVAVAEDVEDERAERRADEARERRWED